MSSQQSEAQSTRSWDSYKDKSSQKPKPKPRNQTPLPGLSVVDPDFIALLLDGNDLIFNTRFLQRGHEGGVDLSSKILSGIRDNLQFQSYFSTPKVKDRRVVMMIFIDVISAVKTLKGQRDIDADVFRDFLAGFEKQGNLTDVVHATHVAAGTKLIAWLKLFSQNPNCKLLIAGVNQLRYAVPLSSARDSLEAQTNLLYLLKTPNLLNEKIDELGLPIVKWDVYFEKEGRKMPVVKKSGFNEFQPYKGNEKAQSTSSGGGEESGSDSSDISNGSYRAKHSVKKQSGPKINPRRPWGSQNPKLCFSFYLNGGCTQQRCNNSHEYELTSAELEELREDCKKFACPHWKLDGRCRFGDECIHHH